MSKAEIEADEANDPLLHTARALIGHSVLSAGQVLDIYNETGERTARVAEEAIKRPRLRTAGDVMASLIPPARECAPTNGPSFR
jgi:2-oxoisovalerate dehydrogenase E1 component